MWRIDSSSGNGNTEGGQAGGWKKEASRASAAKKKREQALVEQFIVFKDPESSPPGQQAQSPWEQSPSVQGTPSFGQKDPGVLVMMLKSVSARPRVRDVTDSSRRCNLA